MSNAIADPSEKMGYDSFQAWLRQTKADPNQKLYKYVKLIAHGPLPSCNIESGFLTETKLIVNDIPS